ncbi:extracellular solute-binding protein [Lachnospiraceae bacterium 29-91]
MKAKKLMALILASAMTFSLALTGCGGDGGNSGESSTNDGNSSGGSADGATEVTFWTLNTRQNAVDPIAEAFNSSQDDVHVTVSYYDTDGIKDACKVAASSKTLPNMWFNWGGSLGGFYAENGLTYDLTQYAQDNNWSDKFTQASMDLCTLDDKLSGYPTSFNVLGIYYRKDIFKDNQIEVPTTFEEFEEVCAKLKEKGITPISTAGLNGWHTMRFVELLIEHYAGSELHDKMNSFGESYDNDAVVQALEKYQEFCDKGYFPEGFLTQDPNDTLIGMANGQCAMDIQGQWQDGKILQEGLDIENYGIFPFPSGETNRMSAFAEMTQFNVDNSEEELDACVKFMDFYYSEENVEQYGEYYNLPLPKVDAAMPDGQPNVEKLMSLAEETGIFTITDQAFPTEVADVLFNAQDAIANGQMTPEEGAKNIQSAIEAYNSK